MGHVRQRDVRQQKQNYSYHYSHFFIIMNLARSGEVLNPRSGSPAGLCLLSGGGPCIRRSRQAVEHGDRLLGSAQPL